MVEFADYAHYYLLACSNYHLFVYVDRYFF